MHDLTGITYHVASMLVLLGRVEYEAWQIARQYSDWLTIAGVGIVMLWLLKQNDWRIF